MVRGPTRRRTYKLGSVREAVADAPKGSNTSSVSEGGLEQMFDGSCLILLGPEFPRPDWVFGQWPYRRMAPNPARSGTFR
jgi:hypothetical protein